MSRRRCDKYSTCKECDCYSQYTEKLKNMMRSHDYKYMKDFLGNPFVYRQLTDLYDGFSKFKKEYNCMVHFYNPNGIYDE